MSPRIELTLRIGTYGERVETVTVAVSEEMLRDLMEPVELSDEPLSLMLASPGVFGGHGNAVTIRKRAFCLRKHFAESLSAALVNKLIELFGTNDETDGYKANGG